MKVPTTFSKLGTISRARVPRILLLAVAVLATTIVITSLLGPATALANQAIQDIFRPFLDDSGLIQSAASDVKITTGMTTVPSTDPTKLPTTAPTTAPVAVPNAPLDRSNLFFNPKLGATGQSCSTCHQPDQGFTIQVDDIQRRFAATRGKDLLFIARNTADNPANAAPKASNYSVVLALGATRIAKAYVPGSLDFTIVAADQRTINKFGVFPMTNDPEMALFGNPQSISAFRRPIVPTNLHLESAVLFDGAVNIDNILGQVTGGTALLGGRVPSEAEAMEVGAFEFGVYTDQVFDRAARPNGAGLLSAEGAEGGVDNLREFALSTNVPCNGPDPGANVVQGGNCTQNALPGFDIFDAWANLPNERRNAARLSVARGQEIFNSKTLHVPKDLQAQLGNTTNCTGCHTKRNVGNNTDRTFFVRLGTDSVAMVTDLIKGGGVCASNNLPHPELREMLKRIQLLPEYRVTANTGPLPAGCGVSTTGDIITSDPGRAMASGKVADTAKFRPVILRGLAARSPYFHAGVAGDIETLINFYNARFSIGLTPQEKRDLAAFLESL